MLLAKKYFPGFRSFFRVFSLLKETEKQERSGKEYCKLNCYFLNFKQVLEIMRTSFGTCFSCLV